MVRLESVTNSRRVLVLQHTDTTTPGSVPDLLARAGHHAVIGALHRGFELPPPRHFDAVVVCGGGVHVHQDDAFPFLKPEKEFLRRAVADQVPTMGLCLGAQLLALILGAKVYPHPRGYEVGWHDVDCLADPTVPGFEAAAVRRVSQYHRYVFDLPPGARPLARNAWADPQAFAFADHVLAFGFHPERTATGNEAMAREVELPTTGQCQKSHEILSEGLESIAKIEPWFARVLAGMLN